MSNDECVLPDMGSLAMQRMLGRDMTINCCKVSCSREEEDGGKQRERTNILNVMVILITVQKAVLLTRTAGALKTLWGYKGIKKYSIKA